MTDIASNYEITIDVRDEDNLDIYIKLQVLKNLIKLKIMKRC